MLFAVCWEGAQISDRYGPLIYLLPPRDMQRVRDDEVYVLFDEAPHTYRGYRFGYRRETQGPGLPAPLDAAAWERIGSDPGRVVRVLMFNGFGAGYGDALVGSVVVEAVYRRIQAAGKIPQIDFLIHPYSFERERHFEIYKLNPFIHRLYFTTIKLPQYKSYDYYGTSENFVRDAAFQQQNVYDYFLARLGLPPEACDRQLKLYPDPAVMAEVQQRVAPWRADPAGDPILLLNFFATPLRAIPRFKWPELLAEFARDYRVALTSDADSAAKVREFVAGLPRELQARTIDLSGISSQSFDHLIAVVHHAADAVITPDTSLVHLCGGLGKPCVCIFLTIEPFRVCRHYPTVVEYCHEDFRQSSLWGQSKITDPERRKTPIQEDPELLGLWRGVQAGELRVKLEAARALPRRAPSLPSPVYLARGARAKVLVYSGTAVPLATERDDYAWLLAQILSDECDVEVLRCRPLEFRPLGRCDLLIFGLGDCLFEPIVRQPGLVRFLRAARRRLGVFGTQYPDSLPAEIMADLVGSLDRWFAATRRDLTRFGPPGTPATWFGQWQATLVPSRPWVVDREVIVDEEQARTDSWEANLRSIQDYRRVRCSSSHALLCALGAAEEVCYCDPRAYRDQPSGRGGAVLEDIFGTPVPDATYFPVAAERFAAYKQQIRQNIAALRAAIAELLND